MRLYYVDLLWIAAVAEDVARFPSRLSRAAKGYALLGRSWHCAWIMAERP